MTFCFQETVSMKKRLGQPDCLQNQYCICTSFLLSSYLKRTSTSLHIFFYFLQQDKKLTVLITQGKRFLCTRICTVSTGRSSGELGHRDISVFVCVIRTQSAWKSSVKPGVFWNLHRQSKQIVKDMKKEYSYQQLMIKQSKRVSENSVTKLSIFDLLF